MTEQVGQVEDIAAKINAAIEAAKHKGGGSKADVDKATDSEGPKTKKVETGLSEEGALAKMSAKELNEKFVSSVRDAVKGYVRWSKLAPQIYTVVSHYIALRGGAKGAQLEIFAYLVPELKGAAAEDYRGKLSHHYNALMNAYRSGERQVKQAEEKANAQRAHNAIIEGFVKAGASLDEAKKLADAKVVELAKADAEIGWPELTGKLLGKCAELKGLSGPKARDFAFSVLMEIGVHEERRIAIMKKFPATVEATKVA